MELTTGEVATGTGVTERTLRYYYEELGLLAPARDSGGRRRYNRADSGSPLPGAPPA